MLQLVMSTELLLQGQKCNLGCTYCYEEPMREAGNEDPLGAYDLEKVKQAILKENGTSFAFFGGEPLLTPIPDLRELMEFGRANKKAMSIQTNGALMTERHFDLLKEFKVSIGMSIDGPGLLNRARETKNDPRGTDKATEISQWALEKALRDKISCSLIVTVHQWNAGNQELLDQMGEWLGKLMAMGLKYVNFHPLEIEGPKMRHLVLTVEQATTAMRYFRNVCKHIHASPFNDMRKALLGEDDYGVNCVWHACDPYTTAAVHGIDGAGELGNCGRTNKDGVAYQKAQKPAHVRQLSLYLTPQEMDGCSGCRFFYACKGECPGTGEGEDWRARTAHCGMLINIFTDIENELRWEGRSPISQQLIRPAVEAKLLAAWERGENMSISYAIKHLNSSAVYTPHGDAPHGDTPHGDSHGDHTDASKA